MKKTNKKNAATYSRISTLALVLAIVLSLGTPVLTARSTLLAQAEDLATSTTSLLLGEFAYQEAVNEEIFTFEIEIPQSGSYLFIPDDEDEAFAFDFLVTPAGDEDGENIVHDDVFGQVELVLEAGSYTLQFTAVDDAALSFFVLGQLGEMSADVEAPGQLSPGSMYSEEAVTGSRYGILSIPPLDIPQEVLIFAEPAAGDSLFLEAEGDDIFNVAVEINADNEESKLLRFWTEGGDYRITTSSTLESTSLQLIVFLGGTPELILMDDLGGTTLETVVEADAPQAVYQINLDSFYDSLLVELTSNVDPAATLAVVDRLYSGNISEVSYGDGFVELSGVLPGAYYIVVERPLAIEGAYPFNLTVSGVLGPEIQTMENGVAIEGELSGVEDSVLYQFEVEQAGALITAAIASETSETDFDVNVSIIPNETIWSSFQFGSNESVSFVAPFAGTYYISITSDEGSGTFVTAAVEDVLAPELALNASTVGSVEEQSDALYRMEIDEPGQLLSIILTGFEAEADLDLKMTLYEENGDTTYFELSFASGPYEIISIAQAAVGIYEVEVEGDFSIPSDFMVTTRLEDPQDFLSIQQWAVDAVASSQFGDSDWSALQATGPPDTFEAGDIPTAWAPGFADDTVDTIDLFYEKAVVPSAINIYETFNPGAVISVEAYNDEADSWITLWAGEDTTTEAPGIFSPSIAQIVFATDAIRLTVDTSIVPGYNEIDAVELVGTP